MIGHINTDMHVASYTDQILVELFVREAVQKSNGYDYGIYQLPLSSYMSQRAI